MKEVKDVYRVDHHSSTADDTSSSNSLHGVAHQNVQPNAAVSPVQVRLSVPLITYDSLEAVGATWDNEHVNSEDIFQDQPSHPVDGPER